MKAVILAGGTGTRISEESHLRPKPMVTIGEMPILWHIMKIYSRYGIRDFVVCLGFKGYVIKEYFANYMLHSAGSVTFDFRNDRTSYTEAGAEPWKVTLVETGLETQTGGRLRRIRPWVAEDDAFCMTYGDGLADIDISALVAYHRAEGRPATVTTVAPPGRFGVVEAHNGAATSFSEKPSGDGTRISGGFFVLSPEVLDLVDDDATAWEHGPLRQLAAEGKLSAFAHEGFWQPMDTIRERNLLQTLWETGEAPWRVW